MPTIYNIQYTIYKHVQEIILQVTYCNSQTIYKFYIYTFHPSRFYLCFKPLDWLKRHFIAFSAFNLLQIFYYEGSYRPRGAGGKFPLFPLGSSAKSTTFFTKEQEGSFHRFLISALKCQLKFSGPKVLICVVIYGFMNFLNNFLC